MTPEEINEKLTYLSWMSTFLVLELVIIIGLIAVVIDNIQ